MSEITQSSISPGGGSSIGDLLPRPDPTVLTTQQLLREVSSVREILESRLNGMDKAIALLQASVDRSPTIPEVVAEFREKFTGVDTRFQQRDIMFELAAKSDKDAIVAALQAAKEAVAEQNKSSATAIAKAETATTKQMDSITTLIQTNQKAIDEKITDVKDRITVIEGRGQGISSTIGILVGVGGLVLALIATIISLIVIYKH
jgi:hypothetical protein